jgi:hypothetical protein
VKRSLKSLAAVYDQHEAPSTVLITAREGLHHRRNSGHIERNARAHANGNAGPTFEPEAAWKRENQFLNGKAKAASMLTGGVDDEVDPDRPIVAGRSMGCIPADDSTRLRLYNILTLPQFDQFIMVTSNCRTPWRITVMYTKLSFWGHRFVSPSTR